MSKMGSYRMMLQERPEYSEGYEAYESGKDHNFNPWPIDCLERQAWVLGWDDARNQEQSP